MMQVEPIQLEVYQREDGGSPFADWIRALHDRVAASRVRARLARLRLGNFGDTRALGGGVHELRMDHGPGYRIYYGRIQQRVVLLLCGGTKGTQARDIEHAQLLARFPKKVTMTAPSRPYQQDLVADLQDPNEAAAYLTAALNEEAPEVFLVALRDVAEAHGMKRLAEGAQLNRESLYRMLSERGNPQLSSLTAVLEQLGLRLAVQAKEPLAA